MQGMAVEFGSHVFPEIAPRGYATQQLARAMDGRGRLTTSID